MTIQELIDETPSKILQRGQCYYADGNILELNRGRNGIWYAEVEGNYGTYDVEIDTDTNNYVTDYKCNCPYEGDICKHIAAVALLINEKKSIAISADEDARTKNWEDLIDDAEVKDLKGFMIDYGQKSRDFRQQIELRFSEPVCVQNSDNISFYQSQISGIFNYYDDEDYIDYRSAGRAMNDVYPFLIKAEACCSKGHMNDAFGIASAIAMEATRAIQHMDDSTGQCGGVIDEAFLMIERILNNKISDDLKEKIFNWLYAQVKNSDYNDYGVGDQLEPLFFETALSLKQLDIAYKFIDDKIDQLDTEDTWNKDYYLQIYLGQKVNLLRQEDRILEADKIIDSNLHLEEFRQIRVEEAISDNHFSKAEKLIHAGIKIAKQNDALGTVHEWKDRLLELYKQGEESSKYNNLSRELFVENTSSINYFRIYKQTSSQESWEEQRTKLIAELKSQKREYYNGIFIDDLANIYIEEQMTDELFELVKSSNSVHSTIKYTKYLKDEYPSGLLVCYKSAIEAQAVHTGRKVYEELVGYMEQMSKLENGLEAAKAIKNALLEKYKNRPAMKEEFGKLNWD